MILEYILEYKYLIFKIGIYT